MADGDKPCTTVAKDSSSTSDASGGQGAKPKKYSQPHKTLDRARQQKSGQASQSSEEELEACMQASEHELQQVTDVIQQSWAKSGSGRAPKESAKTRHSGSSDSAGSARSSHSFNVMDQLMCEMDQAFQDILLIEDDWKCVRHSMTTSDTSSYSEDIGTTSGVEGVQTQLEWQDEDRGPQSSKLRNRKLNVPLADLEEFCEENGGISSTDDGASNVPGSKSSSSEPDSPSNASAEACGARARRRHRVRKKAMNGPLSSVPHHIVDMNGNGMTKTNQRWLDKRIRSYEDLEKTFTGNGTSEDSDHAQTDYDMLEFGEKYFNVHLTSSAFANTITKTVNIVRRKSNEIIPVEDMLKYTKNSTITTSHVHLLDPENVTIACSIFKDLCKFIKGELKSDMMTVLRSIITLCIERIELRDEIFCQLVRLSHDNPSEESCIRVWKVMCLCSVSFSPSRTLRKYLVPFVRARSEEDEASTLSKYASYCLLHISQHREKTRTMPPSETEIDAVFNLQPLVFRIYFLDGKTKAIALDPAETVAMCLEKIREKISLEDIHGWALYESTPEHDRYIHECDYLSDVLSDWEDRHNRPAKNPLVNVFRKQKGSLAGPSTPKKLVPTRAIPALNYGKLILCKRLCQRVSDIPDDKVELRLLYGQAVHYVVHLDEYNAPPSVAVHLAGLQAQVECGDYDEEKLYRYNDLDEFLCQRVIVSDSRDWSRDLAAAHKRFGKGKTLEEAQHKYLTIVSQFPLYGCTKIFAHYRGVWPYGIETILAVNFDGIKFISIQEKTIAFEFYYAEIQDIILEEKNDECHVIIQLKNHVSASRQKCFMFECLDLDDFATLIECYSPQHAKWTQSSRSWRRKKFKPPDDWLKLYDDILGCRRSLLKSGVMQRPAPDSGGLLRNALNRLSGRNCSSSRQDQDVALSQGSYWTFSKVPFKTSLVSFETHEMEDISARMFNSTLVYTGLESAAVLEDMDLVVVVQTLITKCMENDDLCNEFYLQLIKQTTDTHSDKPAVLEMIQRAIIRYWHLMTMATCVMLPPSHVIFSYLNLHLRRYAMQDKMEEGKYALFCIKSLYRTYENKGRKYPPSYKEICFVTKRQPIEARVFLTDGHPMLVEFDSASTAEEVMQIVMAKSGMRLDAVGYGIFQVLGDKETFLLPQDKLADALYNWERWARANSTPAKELKLLFKKRLFLDPYFNLNDPVEIDMLYHQSVTEVFEQKIPLTKSEAVEMCALRAQTEFSDYDLLSGFEYSDKQFDPGSDSDNDMPGNSDAMSLIPDYKEISSSVMRILPRHLRDLIKAEEITAVHKTLAGTSALAANIAFLNILKQWPLYGATMFDVTQSGVESLPKAMWLAVSQHGLHLMEWKGPNIFFTYPYAELADVLPTQKNLTVTFISDSKNKPYVFFTTEADQIVQQMKDYKMLVEERRASISSKESDVNKCSPKSSARGSAKGTPRIRRHPAKSPQRSYHGSLKDLVLEIPGQSPKMRHTTVFKGSGGSFKDNYGGKNNRLERDSSKTSYKGSLKEFKDKGSRSKLTLGEWRPR